MAVVYYKFKSAKKYYSITIVDHFISVFNLKQRIFESKRMERGTDFDLIITNAQTNEEYVDQTMLIAKNTSVSVRRVPRPSMPIVIPLDKPKVDDHLAESNSVTSDSSVLNNVCPIQSEPLDYYDDFGDEIYATTPKVTARESSILVKDSTPLSKADEDSKIKALIESSGLDWQRQASNGFAPRTSYGLPQKTPPQGYICHRCKISGHYIQHCPTNGDPNFDIRKLKSPTGIPKSLLVPTPDGLYALANGTSAVLKPNEAAFEKEIERIPSTRSIVNLPPELHCPLCNEVMKDAVFASKCCFRSFCDKCIRDCIISKSMCYCKATNILADDLLPNTTVRDTINRILESGNSSTITDNLGSSVVDMESAPRIPPKIPSPCQSDASNVDQATSSNVEGSHVKENVEVSKPTRVSARGKKRVLQSGAFAVEEAQKKLAAGDARTDMDVEPAQKKRLPDDYMGRFNASVPCNMGYLVPQNFGYPPFIPSHPPWSHRELAAKFSDHSHRGRERSRERYSVERDQDSDRERRRKSIHSQSDRDHGHYHRRIKC